MRIATWNVNSVRQRQEALVTYLQEIAPDVLCLQEIKCLEAAFPYEAFEGLGYNIAVSGQKTFNGVAIFSKYPMEIEKALPGDEADLESRYIEALIETKGGVVRVASLYLPNGNPLDSPKYVYKLAWMDRLIQHAKKLLAYEEPLILAGDYNVIPEKRDVRYPENWEGDALFDPRTRAKFRELLYLGFEDALRVLTSVENLYTFWNYRAGAWNKNDGIRIDHLLLSPLAADRLLSCTIDSYLRGQEKPSDHVPVRIELK